jgi:hypothetical protein
VTFSESKSRKNSDLPTHFPTFPQPICKTILLSKRFKKAGFSAAKTDHSRFCAKSTEIRKNVPKNAPFRPVMKIRLSGKYAHFEP